MECLVTKLKGTASDNTLPKYGILKFEVRKNPDVVEPSTDNLKFDIEVTEDAVLKVVGNGYIGTDPSQIDQPEITIQHDEQTTIYCIAPDNTGYDLEIEGRVVKKLFANALISVTADVNTKCLVTPVIGCPLPNLERLNYNGVRIKGSLDYLAGNNKLNSVLGSVYVSGTAFADPYANLEGSIESLKDAVGLTAISVNSAFVNGDIASLGNLTSLTRIQVSSMMINGDLVDFALNQIANERTSATIYLFRPFNNRCKFGDKGYNRGVTVTLKWDTDKIWAINPASSNPTNANAYIYFKRINDAVTSQDLIDYWTSSAGGGYSANNIFEVDAE